MIDCYQLEIARDIPEEFTLLENNYENLKNTHLIIKRVFFGIGIGIVVLIIINTYNHQKERHN